MDDLRPCLVVHHGGVWVDGEEMYYRGGRINVFDDIPHTVDSSYVKQLIDSLGYTDIVKLHFLDPRKTMQDGISKGTNEDDVEFVSSRDKLTQEKKDELEFEDKLVMLQRIADSKGKEMNMFGDDWEGLSDEDSPSDS
uniref:PB1-like domain-containing protein n=1 Tax=Chenopodium quinoa TaxID=63459 RepID=A0A803LPQ8_CHEQI